VLWGHFQVGVTTWSLFMCLPVPASLEDFANSLPVQSTKGKQGPTYVPIEGPTGSCGPCRVGPVEGPIARCPIGSPKPKSQRCARDATTSARVFLQHFPNVGK